MNKQKETFIDGATKNGVSKRIAENLFNQMLDFAAYCFNKSHSMAYAYVTYQTAFLKANYPVEYMAALLTANSDDQDKVKKYIDSCQKMNIQVEQPDINRSGVDFTPLEKSILFGLSAVRNVGENAIASILNARNEGGAFKSLADLCERVDLRAVNRRALEALIKCGAFDSIQPNRNQLMHDLDLVVSWAQDRAKDKAIGQGSLFDLLEGMTNGSEANSAYESAPKHSPVPDFSSKEKLQMEKELLGFYVSEHPLKFVGKAAQVLDLTPISLSQLGEQKNKKQISTIVMLTAIKQVVTKKGDPMAILQIEDISGQAEAVVFPKIYDSISEYLIPDARLILKGNVDKQDERTQLIVEDAEPVEAVQMVMVELTPQRVHDDEQLKQLQSILQEQRGNSEKAKIPVVAIISDQNGRVLWRLDPKDWVQDSQATVNALKNARFDARCEPLISH